MSGFSVVDAVRVCASDALADGGAGVRVDATLRGEPVVVFFV
ncbi:MAG: Rieske (2Fe-2S) protein, partial [Burkholderia sp.]|nr:Rieske (2Fe-2S) protein [Burkholderia sp.]